MINSAMFRKHLLVVVGVLAFFILWGVLVNHWLMKITMENRPPPPLNTARILAAFADGDYVAALKKVEKTTEPGGSRLSLWNAERQLIYPLDRKVELPSFVNGLPEDVFEQRIAGDPPSHIVVRLPGEPVTYLMLEVRWKIARGPGWSALIIMAITVLLGAGSALILIYRSFDGMVALADQVITQLQNGNLKARFPIRRNDEIGQAMKRFNTMAEEIERLVEQVRHIEHSRMSLLQDLAHDLRTPVASIKTLIETLSVQGPKLTPEIQSEILRLAEAEVGYFEKLVEDLLFLARVGEPRYQVGHEKVDLSVLINQEGKNALSRSESQASNLNIECQGPANWPSQSPGSVEIHGDEQLLRRMLRNAIENAKSFAQGKVLIRWEIADAGRVDVFIEDDGPGFGDRKSVV